MQTLSFSPTTSQKVATMLAKILGILFVVIGGVLAIGVLFFLIGSIIKLLWFVVGLLVPIILLYIGYRLLTRDSEY